MLSEIIQQAEDEFREDHQGCENLEELTTIFVEGMKKGFVAMFEQQLYGGAFDICSE